VPVTAPPVQAVSEQTSIDPDDVPY
jgi:hypothetical protein